MIYALITSLKAIIIFVFKNGKKLLIKKQHNQLPNVLDLKITKKIKS